MTFLEECILRLVYGAHSEWCHAECLAGRPTLQHENATWCLLVAAGEPPPWWPGPYGKVWPGARA